MAASQENILRKLLLNKQQQPLLLGAVIGAFLGFLLLVLALQFYLDLQHVLAGEGKGQFVQVNKKVNVFNTIGVKSTFSTSEIEAIKTQPFVLDVGVFASNDFKVRAYSELLGFYSELFFEAIPERFLDVDEPRFRWSEGQRKVPVLISRDYLALYNFGFAPSQGLPQISAASVKRMNMDLRISGQGREEVFEGQVVGFSDRVNSILVPPDFLAWANQHFGGGHEREASRLFLKVTNPMDTGFQDFLQEKGYEVSSGRLIGGQFVTLFNLLVGVVAVFGLFLLVLAAAVFLLIYQLLIARSAESIRLLLQLGYPARTIGRVLSVRFAALLAGVVLAALSVSLLLRHFLAARFSEQGFDLQAGLGSLTWALLFGLGGLLLWLNLRSIRSNIHQLGLG